MPENLLRRKTYDRLLSWKEASKGSTALLLEGARRVGKSTISEEFASKEYRSHILIDFARAGSDVRSLFDGAREDLDRFFSYLSALYGVILHERDSIIVFDEVQRFPPAREFVKYLVADGRYDYLETGSLISIKANVRDIVIPSEERRLPMEPLDFEEFLWACGEEQLAGLIAEARANLDPLPDALHKKASRLMREYLLVGGMPQAVVQFLGNKDFGKVDEVKRGILDLYQNDVSKFGGSEAAKVRRLLRTVPGQLAKHEKKFTLAAVDKGARTRTWEGAFEWLEDARMVNLCRNATDPAVALPLSEDDDTLKCYMADTGLLCTQAFAVGACTSDETYRAILFDKLETHEGMLVENYVAQQLKARGDELFFYSRYDREDSSWNMELDFLVVRPYADAAGRPRVCAVEAKSGRRYGTSSLGKFREKFGDVLGLEYVLHPRQLKVDGKRVYLPLYMAHVL